MPQVREIFSRIHYPKRCLDNSQFLPFFFTGFFVALSGVMNVSEEQQNWKRVLKLYYYSNDSIWAMTLIMTQNNIYQRLEPLHLNLHVNTITLLSKEGLPSFNEIFASDHSTRCYTDKSLNFRTRYWSALENSRTLEVGKITWFKLEITCTRPFLPNDQTDVINPRKT